MRTIAFILLLLLGAIPTVQADDIQFIGRQLKRQADALEEQNRMLKQYLDRGNAVTFNGACTQVEQSNQKGATQKQ